MKNDSSKKDFNDQNGIESFTTEELIKGAYAGANPALDLDLGKIGTDHALMCLDRLYARLLASVAKSSNAGVLRQLPPVLRQLPPVLPLDEQIEVDREQFPTLTAADRDSTEKLLAGAKKTTRLLVGAIRDNPGMSDPEKLRLAAIACLHLQAAAVYHDRLEQNPPKPPSTQPKGNTP